MPQKRNEKITNEKSIFIRMLSLKRNERTFHEKSIFIRTLYYFLITGFLTVRKLSDKKGFEISSLSISRNAL